MIDGLPGSGKTTMATRLGSRLEQCGVPVKVYEELCNDHPLRIYDPIYSDFTLQDQSSEFRSRSLELFRQFVERSAQESTVNIFDSWLFQDVIGFAFNLRMDYSDSTDFALNLAEIISPLEPVIIYIAQADVEQNWRRICGIRGPEWTAGRCGILQDQDYVRAGVLWSANQAFCLALLQKSGLRNLVITNADYDFESHQARVLEFLQVPPG
jgi:hypothetical protein